jgi:hypothetical protein
MSVTLEYTINLTDKDAVDRLQKAAPLKWTPVNSAIGLAGGWGTIPARSADMVGKVYGAPYRAARRDWLAEGGLAPVLPILVPGQAFASPCITSPWITKDGQTTNPIDKDEFRRKKSGFWAWLFGLEETYVWVGTFNYSPAAPTVTPGTTTPVSAISERRWVDGFDHPDTGEGGSSSVTALFTRAASRHADGYGLAFRSTGGGIRTHALTEHGATASTKSWERFYIRPRAYPTNKVPFWRTHGSISSAAGIQLAIEATGRLSINDTTAFDVMTIAGQSASPIPLNVWTRVDVVFSYATGGAGAGARFELWLNGVLSVNIASFDNSGLGIAQNHQSSDIGNVGGYETRNLGLDVDDWMNAVPPSWTIDLRTGNDWKNGSRIVRISPKGFSASNGTFAGDWRGALQEPAADAVADQIELTSSSSGDVLALTTDAELAIDGTPGAIGCVAFAVGIYSSRAGTGNGQIGYSIAGAAPTYKTMTDSTSPRWNTIAHRPTGALTPTAVTPLEFFHTKAATVSLEKVYTVVGAAELIGIFGNEDVVASTSGAAPVVVGNTGLHNAPYPRSAWAKATNVPPVAPVAIIADTYIGNGTGQDLVFTFPPTWLMIRHVDAAANGTAWWSSMLAAHHHFGQAAGSNGAVQVCVDPDFEVVTGSINDQMQRYIVRVVGDEPTVNANGESYAYVAFCDPGMRFSHNGAITWPIGTLDRVTSLFRTNFLADVAFFHREAIAGTTSGCDEWYKGVGHATQSLSKLNAAETASAVLLSKGSITTKSAIHAAVNAIAFALFRRNDGSGAAGIPKVLQVWNYTGDGTGVRTLAFNTVTLVRPVFAIVVPHNAAAVYRDHEHTGTSSTTYPDSSNAANGIRGGGVDQLIVGSDLNALGIVYDVFVLPGGATACNGGFSCPGIFVPVDPEVPPGWNGCDPIDLSPSTLAAGMVGSAYDATITATGGLAPYTFDVSAGSLPDGLSLSSGGVISGTPTSDETVSFEVQATDANDCIGTLFYTISFNADGCPDVAIAPEELTEAVVGVAYTQTLEASGGDGPYTFTVSVGALPDGFTLSTAGTLTGTLASTDVLPFTVRATDINGCFGEHVYSLVPDEVGGGPACIAAGLAIVNRALSRIGITKAIVNMATDLTPEATMARLHYANDVDTVLRDFPWPFATKYATLSRVAGSVGTPVNVDWRYSYRQPNGCLFERRIVVARGAGIDPVPPPFQLSADTAGGLILTNQASAVLEYTARPNCAALRGDALFRDALTWRVALSLAPALSRIADVAINAEKMYAASIALAASVLRPGNPGAPPAAATIDTAASAVAANLAVVNRALVRIGANTIANLSTDQSREARAAALVFEEELRATLRELPWPFATGYATLTKLSGPQPPYNADWAYSYRQPTGCLFERRIVVARQGAIDPPPPPFQLSADDAGGLVLTNQVDAVLEYTRRPDGAVNLADGLFREAFAWRLAATLAPSLAQRSPETPEQLGRGPGDVAGVPEQTGIQLRGGAATAAWEMYRVTIEKARAIHKPGNPGALPAVPTVDVCSSCQLANVAAVNRALGRIGAQTVRDLLTDQSREAAAARLVFEDELRGTLYDFPWPFATRFANLDVVTGPTPAATPDWLYAYRQPADCLFERRLVVKREGAVDPTPPPFQLSSDETGGLIYTNQPAAVLEYTARPEGAVMRGDLLFRDAFSWRLAAALAPSLGTVNPDADEQVGRGPDVPGGPPAAPGGAAGQARMVDAFQARQMYEAVLAKARSVIRPGVPGALPAAPTIDVSAEAQRANVLVVNRALSRIGAQTIPNLTTDQSREANAARLIFEDELRSTLRDHPWAFATSYITPELAAGTEDEPVNLDWQYAYRLPEIIFARRIVTERKRAYDPNPKQFRLGVDSVGPLIFVNDADPTIEVTVRPEGAVAIADAIFRDAFAWRLAAALAPTLAMVDPSRNEQAGRGPDVEKKEPARMSAGMRQSTARWAFSRYLDAIALARTADAREQQQDPTSGDADWITGRN